MNASNPSRFALWVAGSALAALMLAPVSEVLAQHHMAGRDNPWNSCTFCHGGDLLGDLGPSCMSCHNDFSSPDPPASGHHMSGRDDPVTNCGGCHGADLLGGWGPSCDTCHDLPVAPSGENQPPIVNSGGPYQGLPGEDVQFDASGTTDADGDTLIYLWSFGDGTQPQFPSMSPTISHAYEFVGSYTAVLTVTDGSNDPVMVNVAVEISTSTSNLPPVAVPGGPYSGTAGEPVQFDGSGSSDPDGDTLTYSWNFGDGSAPSIPSAVATVTHTYASVGSYTATLTVNDGVNNPRSASTTVEILNLPPIPVTGGPYSGKAEQSMQFDGSGSFDPEEDPLTYSWDFGDGTASSTPSSVATISHTYASPGSYTAVLTVDDGVNDPESASTTVEVAEAPVDPPNPPAATGDDWELMLPFLFEELTVSFEEFAGILLVHVTPLGGQSSFGIGMEFDGLIFWMDVTGSLFYGSLDATAGTGWGMVFGYQGGASSVWFAERK